MNKKVVLIWLLAIGLFFPGASRAQYYSQGDEKKSILIDKKIRPISDTKYWDNIGKDQKLFVENDTVDFFILVENTGNKDLFDVSIKDNLPKYQNIVFNPGIYDEAKNEVTWNISKLSVGESRSYIIRSRIGKINSDLPLIMTNNVCAYGESVSDCDRASFYGQGKLVPSTGSEDLIWKSMAGMTMGLVALYLRKLARGY